MMVLVENGSTPMRVRGVFGQGEIVHRTVANRFASEAKIRQRRRQWQE
jgi:hypothetical protein